LRRLLPEPGATSVADQLGSLELAELAPDDRPYVITNFAVTLDGHATISGRSGPIAGPDDTAMLLGLRSIADAVLIGAGTIRAENYGRLLPDPGRRARRERSGRTPEPLAVVPTESFEVPWDAGLFTTRGARVLIATSSEEGPPPTQSSVSVERQPGGVDLPALLGALRRERGIRLLLCEGGPRLHGQLHAEGLVDELFVTLAPQLAGGAGPRLLEGDLAAPIGVELVWLLEADGDLLARYRVIRD
jgi:riboflavin-specific deaminase-like protein